MGAPIASSVTPKAGGGGFGGNNGANFASQPYAMPQPNPYPGVDAIMADVHMRPDDGFVPVSAIHLPPPKYSKPGPDATSGINKASIMRKSQDHSAENSPSELLDRKNLRKIAYQQFVPPPHAVYPQPYQSAAMLPPPPVPVQIPYQMQQPQMPMYPPQLPPQYYQQQMALAYQQQYQYSNANNMQPPQYQLPPPQEQEFHSTEEQKPPAYLSQPPSTHANPGQQPQPENRNRMVELPKSDKHKTKYTPYTLRDYQEIKPQKYHAFGGLGANVGGSMWKAQKDKLDRMTDYAKGMQKHNRERATGFGKPHQSAPPRMLVMPEVEEAMRRKAKMLQYAKQVPKPRKPPSRGPPRAPVQRSSLGESEDERLYGIGPVSDLERLEMQHNEYMQQVERMKHQFIN